jgi:2-polyprenyl-3-methyl-5-hydroxy-6-metoxy-1,4-benzoquinol methylase
MLKTLDRCPLCGSTAIAPDFVARCVRRQDDRDWRVARCAGCTLGFLNPQPDWEELALYYGADYGPYTPDRSLSTFEADVAAARASGRHRHIRIAAGLRILDVGCGAGAFLKVAGALGAAAEGVEPSEHGVKAARAQGLRVFEGQLHDYLKSSDGRRFDVVAASHVVEHHPSPVDVLRQMRSLLAPGGYVWFAVPNAGGETAEALKARWHSVDVPFHLMQFTPASATLAVERAGLKLRRQYTYSLPSAAFGSFCDIWRHRYFAPRKITQRVGVLTTLAATRARAMDERGAGEAIIVEATA